MKITVLFSILLAPAAAGYCADGEGKTFPAAGLESLVVNAVAGPVSVSGAGAGEIAVTLTGTEPEKCVITMKAEGSRLVLKAENALKAGGQEKRGFWKRLFSGEGLDSSRYHTCRLGFTVSAPPALKVSAGSVSGAVSIDGVSGDVDARTVSGGVRADAAAGSLDARTVSGNISGTSCARSLKAVTTSGKIDFKGLCGSAAIDTVSGNVSLAWARLPSGGQARAGTVSGDVLLVFPADAAVASTLSSVSGRKISEFGGAGFPANVKTVSGDISVLKVK